MSELVVISYDDVTKAEDTRLALVKMQQEYLVDLEDAVVAVKKDDGTLRRFHRQLRLVGLEVARFSGNDW